MSLSKAQNTFYWRLWGALRKVDAEADRHALHRQLGLPDSHVAWSNAHLDTWKAHVLALTQPGNYRAQVKQLKMPATRQRVFIGHLLDAMEEPESYAEAILQRMNLRGAEGGPMLTLDTAQDNKETMPEGLDWKGRREWKRTHPTPLADLMIALKKECRRRWRTKEDLLGEIDGVRRSTDIDDTVAADAIMAALCWPSLGPLHKLYYEPLLVVLAVLRRLASGRAAAAPDPQPVEADCPF